MSILNVNQLQPVGGGNTITVGSSNIDYSGSITGNISVDGNLTVTGVVSNEDVTNIDSVGIITARAGVKVPDNQKIFLGTGDDLKIYHDGSINRIRSDVLTVIEKNDSEDMASFMPDGAVVLFHNGSQKFETTSSGVKVSGSFPDFIIHDTDTTNDNFRILHNSGGTQLQVDPNNVSSGSYLLAAIDGSEKLRIDSSGNAILKTANGAFKSENPNSSGDYVRMYAGAGTAQWDIYGNGELLRMSENSGSSTSRIQFDLPTTHRSTSTTTGVAALTAQQEVNNGGYLIFDGKNSSGTSVFNVTHNGRVRVSDGIDFSSNSNAGGMTSELLDDYEEGTWTPIDNSAGLTLSIADGRYVKIGSLVHCWGRLQYPSTSNTSSTAIGGFPFANLWTNPVNYSGNIAITNHGSANILPMVENNQIIFRDYSNATFNNSQLSSKFIYFEFDLRT